MNLQVTIEVFPDQLAAVTWHASAEEKLKLARLGIRERLQQLARPGAALLTFHGDPGPAAKDEAEAAALREAGARAARAGQHLAAVAAYNSAARLVPPEVRPRCRCRCRCRC